MMHHCHNDINISWWVHILREIWRNYYLKEKKLKNLQRPVYITRRNLKMLLWPWKRIKTFSVSQDTPGPDLETQQSVTTATLVCNPRLLVWLHRFRKSTFWKWFASIPTKMQSRRFQTPPAWRAFSESGER